MRRNEMKESKLSELFDMQMGKTPDRNNPEYWQNGVHQWISIADMTSNGKFIEHTKESITQKAVDVTGIKPIYPGTVIMSFKLSVGKVAIATSKCYSNEAIMAFDIPAVPVGNPMLLNDYAYYLLRSLNFDNVGNKAVMGKTLNKAILKETTVKYHVDLDRQSEIVTVLDKVCDLIEKRKQQLQQLDELVKARFVEMFDLQKCKRKPLGECTNFVDYRGHTPELSETGTIRMINAKSVGKGFFKYVDEYVTEETYDSWMHRGFGYPGDILFVTEGHTFGNTCTIPNNLKKFALGQRVITIQGHQELSNAFLCSYMQTDMFWKDINVYRTGGTAQGIRSKDLIKVCVPVPPMELQKQFTTFVEQIDKSKFVVQKALDEAQTLFDSLMQEYFG